MTTRIFWKPTLTECHSYEVYIAPQSGGTFTLATTIYEDRTKAPFDTETGQYYYDDAEATASTIYRVQAFSAINELVADTGPFQPASSFGANLITRVKVDEHYGTADALRYLASGMPVPNALIRVYREADWDLGKTELALYVVETKPDGRWNSPIYLEPGLNYVLVFSKEGSYGPDIVRTTI